MVKHLALAGVIWAAGASAAQATLIVPGTSDPWLAGLPPGSTASLFDVAPDQSPVLYMWSGPSGDYLYFTASGLTDHCDFGSCGLAGPDGDLFEGPAGHSTGAENSLSNIIAPIDALVGVFLGPSAAAGAAPATLDFSTPASRDFEYLYPTLGQIFFIGDGRTSMGGDQYFAVPSGATRLFLGTMDGFGWLNNVGAFEVDILHVGVDVDVPEPASLLLFGTGTMAAAAVLRRRRRSLR